MESDRYTHWLTGPTAVLYVLPGCRLLLQVEHVQCFSGTHLPIWGENNKVRGVSTYHWHDYIPIFIGRAKKARLRLPS